MLSLLCWTQEALARQRAESATTPDGHTPEPVQRSGSPWDSAWDQQSAAVRGQGLTSHERGQGLTSQEYRQGLTSRERLLSGLATARRREHSSGVFGSIVDDYRPSQHASDVKSHVISNRTHRYRHT